MSFPLAVPLKAGMEKDTTSTNRRGRSIGTRGIMPDGREFVWSKAAATAIITGALCQQQATSATYDADIAVATAEAAGSVSIGLTNAGATLAVNTFQYGFMHVNDVDGEGHNYLIKSHTAATTTQGITVTLAEDDGIKVALTTSSQVGLRKHPYDAVIIYPTTLTGIPIGVTPIAITASHYFWMQTYGSCTALSDAVIGITGQPVVPSFSVAGAVRVQPKVYTTSGNRAVAGMWQNISVSTEYGLIFLTLGSR